MNETEQASIGVDDLRDLVGEIRLMARRFLSFEGTHSFTPTALAMTALRRAKLSDAEWTEVRWENRAHFFSSLAQAMRHALIDHARRRRARGREQLLYLPPDESIFRDLPAAADSRAEPFIQLEDALVRLELLDPRLSEVIQQHYYLGYTIRDIAGLSNVSEKTVDRDLKKARILLRKLLDQQ